MAQQPAAVDRNGTREYHSKEGGVTGYKGKDAGDDAKFEKKKPTGPAVGELEKKGTTPRPVQKDYATTAEWMTAMRKWREQEVSARDAATALAAKPSPTPKPTP